MHVERRPSVVADTRNLRDYRPAIRPEIIAERSIVIPVFNGSASVAVVVDELLRELADRPTEIILVNDGSRDDSERRCRELVEQYPGRVTLVQFSRNFGEYAAVLAGLRQCSGEFVVVVDDDGQQPAAEVGRLVQTIEQGRYDVVYGRYLVQRQAWWRRCASRAHNAGVCWFLGKPRGLYLSSFKAMSRFVVAQICDNAGSCPYFDGFILQITDNIAQLDVLHRTRRAGTSGYTLPKLLRVWFDMCIGFSMAPFRIASTIGAMLCVAGIIAMFVALWNFSESAAQSVILTGWTTALGGAILFYLGLTGEHLTRGIGGSSKSRPPYVIRYVHRVGVTHGG